jgi:hypothetical protein
MKQLLFTGSLVTSFLFQSEFRSSDPTEYRFKYFYSTANYDKINIFDTT